MYAKILTVHVLIPNDAHVALITDGLNEGFHEGFDPGMILDWAYDDAGPEGITPPTVWVPDERLRSIDQGGGFDSSSDEAQMLRDMVGYAAVAFGIVGWPYERRQK
jgi:hypothetical protein